MVENLPPHIGIRGCEIWCDKSALTCNKVIVDLHRPSFARRVDRPVRLFRIRHLIIIKVLLHCGGRLYLCGKFTFCEQASDATATHNEELIARWQWQMARACAGSAQMAPRADFAKILKSRSDYFSFLMTK